MHILALDWGSKKCGLAFRASTTRIVFPVGILTNDENLIFDLSHLIQDRMITHLIIGSPQHPRSTKAIEMLKNSILHNFPGIDVQYIDEAYTSVQAQETLGSRTHAGEDAVAAMHLLEHFLITKMSTEQTTISGL